VAKILGDGSRKRSTLFAALESHYVFEGRYGRPGKGNDKGKVEGMVGFARRTFMVPFPRVPDFAEFNIMLEEGCRERQGRIPAWRHDHDRHAHDSRSGGLRGATRDTVRCLRQTARAGDQVRYKNTDYSVPVAYAHRDVMVKGYVDDVVITSGADEIARHRRSYDAGDFVFDPLHYLALLEQKVGALDQAAPLQGWSLPIEFATLRRLLEARLSQKNRCADGKREYVQILRLIETFPLALVHGAVRDALRFGAISYDAVKHLALCPIQKRPARLDLARYPHLALTAVAATSASSYMSLLSGAPA